MTKKLIKIILAAMAISVAMTFLAVIVVKGLIGLLVSVELIDTSVSPEGRWKIKVYATDVGAMGSPGGFAKVLDLKGKVPTHEIVLGDVYRQKGSTIHWKDANNVNIHGIKTNVLTGFVYEEKSVSPNRRWKVEVYYVSPVDRPHYYAVEATDLKKQTPLRKIKITEDKIRDFGIGWKNNNIINIYGVVIDLRKAGRGAQQGIVADKRTPDVLTFKELFTKSETWDMAKATLFWLFRAIVFN